MVEFTNRSSASTLQMFAANDDDLINGRRYLRRLDLSSSANNSTYLSILLTVLFVTVGCIFCFCLQFFRSIVNRPRPDRPDNEEDNPSSVVREGIIANLTPRQRRAVLETFFSDTASKVNPQTIIFTSLFL